MRIDRDLENAANELLCATTEPLFLGLPRRCCTFFFARPWSRVWGRKNACEKERREVCSRNSSRMPGRKEEKPCAGKEMVAGGFAGERGFRRATFLGCLKARRERNRDREREGGGRPGPVLSRFARAMHPIELRDAVTRWPGLLCGYGRSPVESIVSSV